MCRVRAQDVILHLDGVPLTHACDVPYGRVVVTVDVDHVNELEEGLCGADLLRLSVLNEGAHYVKWEVLLYVLFGKFVPLCGHITQEVEVAEEVIP
jgi:hypothetical protein